MPELRQMKVSLLLVLLNVVISLAFGALGGLPDVVPLGWWQGEPVTWGSKWSLLLRVPGFMIVILAAILVGLRWDRTLIGRRRAGALGPVLVLFFATATYGHLRMLLLAASGAQHMAYNVGDVVWAGAMFMGAGNYVAKTESNGFWAFQFPWLKRHERAYLKTQRMAAWLFVGVGAVFILSSPLLVTLPKSLLMALMPVTIVALIFLITLASWLCARGEYPTLEKQT